MCYLQTQFYSKKVWLTVVIEPMDAEPVGLESQLHTQVTSRLQMHGMFRTHRKCHEEESI